MHLCLHHKSTPPLKGLDGLALVSKARQVQGKQVYAGGDQLYLDLFEKNKKNVVTITFSHIEP